MCPCSLKARYTVQSCCPPSYTELKPVRCTYGKAACLHDVTSAFDHEDNLDGQTDKQGNTRTNKEILERTGMPSMEDLLIRKNLRWTGHLMRMSPDRLPKQVLYSQLSSGHREGALVSGSKIPSRKPEAERHKDQLIDILAIIK